MYMVNVECTFAMLVLDMHTSVLYPTYLLNNEILIDYEEIGKRHL